jgi:NAD-dependent protein deacetylase sirtuin 5
LATPEAFARDPSLVWQFYAYRRHKALQAKPNAAHVALAEYTRRNPGRAWTITQNVDGLSFNAGHPRDNIVEIHGDLWTLKCERPRCGYSERNFKDPVVPSLKVDDFPADEKVPDIPQGALPHCPKCVTSLLRPGVVFFNEPLPGESSGSLSLTVDAALEKVEEWLATKVDLLLVVGTSGVVYPAAGYAWRVKMRGAKVAVFNIEKDSEDLADWIFEGET